MISSVISCCEMFGVENIQCCEMKYVVESHSVLREFSVGKYVWLGENVVLWVYFRC